MPLALIENFLPCRLCALVLLVSLAAPCLALVLEQEVCSVDTMSVEYNLANADVILGGIFDIRNPATDGYGCGNPHPGNVLTGLDLLKKNFE